MEAAKSPVVLLSRRTEVLCHLAIYGEGLVFRRLEDELLFLDNAETLSCIVQK